MAPVSAKGSANTECSNLIISSTVRMRPDIAKLSLRLFDACLARPAIHIFLRKMNLREHPADVLRHQVVDGLRMMIERRDRGHNHGAGLLRAQHVFQMNAVEGRVADAEH